MKKKLRMFLCAALTASMMATAPALVQAAEEKETTETTESNAVRQDLAGLKYDHSLELQYADQFSVDYYEDGYALLTIAGDGQVLLVPEGKEAPDVVKKALEEGLMVLTAKDKVRLLPPLTITYDEIDQGVEILKKALS